MPSPPSATLASPPFAPPATDPRVSVVVITRNRRADLLGTLGRLTALPERPRIVLVDNASTDGTPDAVRAAFPAVHVIALERNLGGGARNAGVRAVDTPYVAFCDDDSWWRPGALRAAADLLDEHPRLAVVQGHILVREEERDDPVCLEMAESPLPPAPGQPGHPLLSFVACAVVVRRSAYEEAGGFLDRLGVGGEEEILGFDLAARGWLMSYVPELVAHHHPSRERNPHQRRARGIRNTLWTTWLRRPLLPALVRTWRVLRRLPRDRVSVLGVARAVAGLPWVLRHREPSPPHVERMRRLLEDQQLSSRARRYVS